MRDPIIQSEAPDTAASARWWWKLFETSEDPQVVCGSDGMALHANPKAIRMFRLTPPAEGEEFLIHKVLPPPASQRLGKILGHHTATRETLQSVTVKADDASSLLMDLEIVPLENRLSLVTFKNAMMRHRLEAHVQRLITAIDATPDVFLVTDAELKITYVNPAFQTVTGYGIEEVIGRADSFLRAPSEAAKVREYTTVVSQGREWIGELTNLRRNGEIYQVESTISPIFDISGRFMGYVICERDITMRKHLQDALRTERDFAQSILQSMESAIYSLDCDFRLTHANDGWRHLPEEHGGFHLTVTPEMGRPLLDYVPDPARRAELQALFHEVMDHGEAQSNYFHAADGHYWEVKVSPWVAGAQKRGLICRVEDQTRSHELQNQLFQSQKMEIIGTLAAGVAHDFNNLLQVIIGHVELMQLQAPSGPPSMRQGIEKISMAALRAREITKQLLSFSRPTDEKSVVLDLNRVIKEAAKLARCTMHQNVSLEIIPAAEPIPVRMDPTRASQALLNLCVNAQDAMPQGGQLSLRNAMVEISERLARRHDVRAGKMYGRCTVSDTGGGIAEDMLSQIFQPFFTTKGVGKGTGLGLPIVKRVVQEAGGFIDVESVLGIGTSFHLYLPLAQEQITPTTGPAQPPIAHGKGRILVVDDVDLLRDFAKNFLEMAGFTVFTADNGQEAVQVLEKAGKPIDLILADYSMPGMNGMELLKQVIERWPKTKFIMASGFLDEKTRSEIEKLKASLILKPYAIHDVIKIIMERLSNNG